MMAKSDAYGGCDYYALEDLLTARIRRARATVRVLPRAEAAVADRSLHADQQVIRMLVDRRLSARQEWADEGHGR